MSLHSMQRRLGLVEPLLIERMMREALARARHGPRATFAATLLRWLPGDRESVYLDWTLLNDDELVLLGEVD